MKNNSANYFTVENNLLIGSANGLVTNLAPSSVSGMPLTSTGSSSNPTFSNPVGISGGGTNATSFTQTNGIVTYNGTSLVNYTGPQINSSGVQTNTSQPAFIAYSSSTQNNVTGTGNYVTVVFDQTSSNQGSNFNTSTYIFTAPVNGLYNFSASILVNGLIAGYDLTLRMTINGIESGSFLKSAPNASGQQTLFYSPLVFMTSSSTALVELRVNGAGSNTCGYVGGIGNTYFCGYLAC